VPRPHHGARVRGQHQLRAVRPGAGGAAAAAAQVARGGDGIDRGSSSGDGSGRQPRPWAAAVMTAGAARACPLSRPSTLFLPRIPPREAYTALKLVCWINTQQARLHAAPFRATDCGSKMGWFLGRFGGVLEDPESAWADWQSEYTAVSRERVGGCVLLGGGQESGLWGRSARVLRRRRQSCRGGARGRLVTPPALPPPPRPPARWCRALTSSRARTAWWRRTLRCASRSCRRPSRCTAPPSTRTPSDATS
jgi:hypothetical protein